MNTPISKTVFRRFLLPAFRRFNDLVFIKLTKFVLRQRIVRKIIGKPKISSYGLRNKLFSKNNFSKAIHATMVLVIIASFVVPFIQVPSVMAANLELTPDTDVTAGWLESTGTTAYTLVDELSTAPVTTDYIYTGTAGAGGEVAEFGLTTASNVDAVTNVTIYMYAYSATQNSTADTVGINLRIGGVLQTAITVTPAYSATGVHAWYSGSFSGSWTQAQIDGAQAYLVHNRVGSPPNSADDDIRIATVYANITYTQTSAYEQSAYRWFNNQDASSKPTFAQSWGGTGSEPAYALALDSAGNSYVAGTADSANLTSGLIDQTLVKYDSSGVEQWSKTWGGTGNEYAYAVAVDVSDNIYVAGMTTSTGLTAGSYDQTLVKYNSSGVEQWSKTWGSANDDRAQALALDSVGNIYVAGYTSSGLIDQTLVKYNSSGVEQWSKTWGGDSSDYAYAVALDSSGSVYVAGTTTSTGLTAGVFDQTLVKYNSSGVEQWSKTWGGDGNDSARDLALDSSGNIYVAGETTSTGLTVGLEDQTLVKYNSSGVEQWSKTWGGDSSDFAYAIALDSNGNIYTAGITASTGLTAGNYDQTLVKYNSSGVEQWSKTWGGDGYDEANGLALDISGNIYVAGYAGSTGLTAGSHDQTLLVFDSTGSIANCTLCVDRTTAEVDRTTAEVDRTTAEVNLTTAEIDRTLTEVNRESPQTLVHGGTPASFLHTWGGTGTDAANGLALDTSGNIYAAGQTTTPGLTTGGSDQTLVKYNSSGVEQWSKTWGGTGDDIAKVIALDSSSNIYIAGETSSTGLTAGGQDQTLVKYDSSGVEQWSKTWGGTGADLTYAIALDASGNIYIAGETSSTGLTAGGQDQTLVKYDSSGVEQWSKTWGGTGGDIANALALDSSGNIYVAGSTSSTGLTAGGYDQSLVKYNSNGVEQWSKTWGGADANVDAAYAIALDSSGNIYVAGETSSAGFTSGNYDQSLVKYNSNGVEQWSKTWGSVGFDRAYAIALDSSGNIYVAGFTASTGLTDGDYDQTLIKTLSSDTDCAGICEQRTTSEVDRTTAEVDRTTAEVDRTIAEVDRTTAEVDRTTAEVARNEVLSVATVDVGSALNSVAQDTATLAPESGPFRLRLGLHVAQADAPPGVGFKLQYAQKSGTCDTAFTGETYADVTAGTPIAYYNNPNGYDGQPMITNANDPVHSDHSNILQEYKESNDVSVANSIDIGTDGLWDFALTADAALVGTSYCLRLVTNADSTLNTYSVVPEITTPPLNFTQSSYKWFDNPNAQKPTFAETWGGTGADQANGVALDPSGNIYIAGDTASTGLTAGSNDQTLVKYNSFGVEQWSKTWGGTGVDLTVDLALDSSGNIYVAGTTQSSGLTAGLTDQTLVKYDSSGVEQWSKTWGGTGVDVIYALALDSSGNVYVAGATNSTGLTTVNYDQTLVKYNSSGVEQWSKTWGGDNIDYANALALDTSGNIYVAGETYSTGLTAGSNDQTLVKYDSSGVEQWSKTWGGTGADQANDVALDPSGNIYIAGDTASTGLTAGLTDQTLVKYDSSGVEQWSKTWGGTGADTANALALDPSGNIYVSGSTASTGLTVGVADQTLVKYNISGIEQWSKTWGDTGSETATDLALDTSGNIYVAGYTASTGLTTGSNDQTLLVFDTTGSIADCALCVDRTTAEVDRTTAEVDRTTAEVDRTTAEVDRAVTEVNRESPQTLAHGGTISSYFNTWGGTGIDYSHAIVLDSLNNSYIVGHTISTGITSAGYDVSLVKYNSTGVKQWSKTWGSATDELGYDLARDSSDNIYVVGATNSASLSAGLYDQTLVKYNSNGVVQWSKTWGGAGTDYARAVALDSSGNIYTAGYTDSTGLTAGGYDQTLVKYNANGEEQWSKTWGGTGTDQAFTIGLDSAGNIYTGGHSASTGFTSGGNDQTLVKYNSSGVEQWSKTWGGAGDDQVRLLTLDSSGNIYVVGNTNTTGLTAGLYDQTLIKYDSSGVEQWSKTWGGDGDDYSDAVTLDSSNNIYVAGNAASTGLTSGTYDQTIIKYNSSGVEQWTKTFGGTSSYEYLNAIKLDPTGNILASGHSGSTGLTVGSYDNALIKTLPNVSDCAGICEIRTTTEVDRTMAEVDRTTAEVDRTTSEVDRTLAEVDRTTAEIVRNEVPFAGAATGMVLATQNTSATMPRRDAAVRLRLLLDPTKIASINTVSLKLQYAPRVGTCDVSFTGETYVDIGTGTGFNYYDNTSWSDGDAVLYSGEDPTDSNTVIHQSYEESAPFTNPFVMTTTGQSGLWDIALTANVGALGGNYCFRVVNSDTAATLASYDYIPELTLSPAMSQQLRHGAWFDSSGSKQPFYW